MDTSQRLIIDACELDPIGGAEVKKVQLSCAEQIQLLVPDVHVIKVLFYCLYSHQVMQ